MNDPINEQTLEELLHGIIALGIGAAALFVKNPASRQQAGQIINLVTTEVLPLADDLLAQEAAKQPLAPTPQATPNAKPAPPVPASAPGPVLVPATATSPIPAA